MAANIDPIFPLIPGTPAGVIVNAANTARDGSGSNFFTCFTCGANGGILRKIRFINSSNVVGAGALKVVRIWITDAAGANPLMVGEVVLTAITSSNTVAGQTILWTADDPIPLKSGQLVRITQSLAATAADYTFAYPMVGDY